MKLLGLINKTTVLMYQIIFYIIGYKGKFIDYGAPDYPYKEYPRFICFRRLIEASIGAE
jgi:hypothetical protein